MRTSLVILSLSAMLLALPAQAAEPRRPAPAPADPEKLIQRALDAYKGGKTQQAVDLLQEAISTIQKTRQKGLAGFLPQTLAGWTVGKADVQTVAMSANDDASSMTTVSQSFTRVQDKLDVEVTLTDSKLLAEAQKAMAESYKDPALLQALAADGKTKIELIKVPNWTGWIKTEKGGKTELIAFSGSIMLTLNAEKADAEAVKTVWNAIDLKGLAAAAQAGGKTKPPME